VVSITLWFSPSSVESIVVLAIDNFRDPAHFFVRGNSHPVVGRNGLLAIHIPRGDIVVVVQGALLMVLEVFVEFNSIGALSDTVVRSNATASGEAGFFAQFLTFSPVRGGRPHIAEARWLSNVQVFAINVVVHTVTISSAASTSALGLHCARVAAPVDQGVAMVAGDAPVLTAGLQA